MSGVAVENLLGLWSHELRDAKARLRPLFALSTTAESAASFLDGLLGPERRKTGWRRAEAAGDKGPWRQQAVLGRAQWDADALRDVVRDDALETLADPDATLVIDGPSGNAAGGQPAFSSRARPPAASAGSTPAQPARSLTARSVSSPRTPPPRAMP